MTDVAIEYCARCELAETATTVRRLVCERLRSDVPCERVSLSPSSDRTFRVMVDDEEIWSADPDDRVDPVAALNAIRYRLRAS